MTARTPAAHTQTSAAQAHPAPSRLSRAAVWSVVLSVLTLGGLGSLAGIMLGIHARRSIAQTGERGNAAAVAGIIIGVLTLLLAIGYWVFIAMHTGGGGSGGGGGGGGY